MQHRIAAKICRLSRARRWLTLRNYCTLTKTASTRLSSYRAHYNTSSRSAETGESLEHTQTL
ncbi:hypothetical protein C8T65DRAFT_651128 [Cerioporus squamosus]|nr:hypothetical protein C8T65DRAFT_651128 [Cerioporus squamosus]